LDATEVSLTEEKGKEPLIHVATATNEIVANMWKGVLAENGINCLLKSANLVTSVYASPIANQYEVLVLASEAEKAREILTPFLEGKNQDESQI
jgi:hypothetical protein